MKNLFTSLLLFLFVGMTFAQESELLASDKKGLDINFYFGLGLQYTDALEINPFLSESNVPTVRRFPFELSFGFTGDFGENRIDLDFGFYNQERERGDYGHQLNSAQLSLRYLRNVVQFEDKSRIFIGAGLSYRTSELEFYDKSESIDLNDAGGFGDLAKLNNSQFYIGPSLGFSLFSPKDREEYLRLQLTYDFNISGNSWESDYAQVNNSIEETGNRLRLQVIFPF
ncbi:hypothetical protein [Psychroflexus sediminis]|uniref:Outer membrane protein beta-barrel domain-containing protein n=1 Tax=Psychroflexus sediminis TaxID=470826 RepID=A0A1G7TRI8_9FLAO|nr:hypothetical protein [Psychroflexus sediminis]SDG37792.1 hypothetical protein SAMN04488027_1017 [Psychroflexus sediminis]